MKEIETQITPLGSNRPERAERGIAAFGTTDGLGNQIDAPQALGTTRKPFSRRVNVVWHELGTLTVYTSHKGTELERVWTGRTAEPVVRLGRCPIYVVQSFRQRPGKPPAKD